MSLPDLLDEPGSRVMVTHRVIGAVFWAILDATGIQFEMRRARVDSLGEGRARNFARHTISRGQVNEKAGIMDFILVDRQGLRPAQVNRGPTPRPYIQNLSSPS